MIPNDRLRAALDAAGIGHTIVRSLGHPDRWVTACAVVVEDFARVVGQEATTEHQQALDFLAGLHPGLTIDGPPMEVAQRIFDQVLADRRALQDQIRSMEHNLHTMRALYRKEQADATPI